MRSRISTEELCTMLDSYTDIDDLALRLKGKGIATGSAYRMYTSISNILSKPSSSKETDTKRGGLDYSETKANGVTYRVHGVVHGRSGKRSMFNQLAISDDLKQDIHDIVSGYHNPKKKEDFIIESGLEKILNLPKKNRMERGDIKATGAYIIQNFKSDYGKAMFMYRISSLIIWGYRFTPASIIKAAMNRKYIRYFKDALTSLEGLSRLRRNMRSIWDYPCLERQLERRLREEDDGAGFTGFMLSYLSVLRSDYMAEEAKDYAKKKRLEMLHIVVGLGHEKEIIYALEHPKNINSSVVPTIFSRAKLPIDGMR